MVYSTGAGKKHALTHLIVQHTRVQQYACAHYVFDKSMKLLMLPMLRLLLQT